MQVTLRCKSIISSTNQQLRDSLRHLKHKAVTETAQVPNSNIAYIHFSSVVGASVFYNAHKHQPLEINDQTFTIHPAKFRTREDAKYPHQGLRFELVTAATTRSMPAATSSNDE
ncbi:unnamed protein product [Mucor fragilis]